MNTFILDKQQFPAVSDLRLVAATEFVDFEATERGTERAVFETVWFEDKFKAVDLPQEARCICCGSRVKHISVVADHNDDLYLVGAKCASNIHAAQYVNLDAVRADLIARVPRWSRRTPPTSPSVRLLLAR